MDELQVFRSEQPMSDDKESSYTDSEAMNDVISKEISRGTKGIPLYAVIGISISMAMVSVALPIQQHVMTTSLEKEELSNDTLEGRPVWVDLLEIQVAMVQNLVHASLLGGAGIVAAFRGDAVWLFFARNCSFYFGLPALCYLVVDLFRMFNDDEDSLNPSPTLRIAVASSFVLFTSVAVTTLNRVCSATRYLALEHVRLLHGGTSQNQECRNADFYPQTVAQTTLQASKANIIYYGAKAVEITSLAYAISITFLYLSSHECDTLDERHLFLLSSRNLEAIVERKSGGVVQLLPFEMSYSLGAHQSFLLSLFFLASTYPNCCASVGGAILGSAWRLTLAVCSIVHSLQENDARHTASFIFTAVEGALMVPILFAAVSLLAGTYYKDYNQLSFNGDENINNEIDSPDSTDGENSSPASCCFQCPSLWQISGSPLYSKEKRKGAIILWISSLCLLVEMTSECVAMLKESIWDWNGTHHILKWGMHVVSQYLFVCVMAVSSPQVYRRARFLLFFACPAGTGIAIWQIFTVLISDQEWYQDLGTIFILLLFVSRALCGLGQCIGLLLLYDSNVDSSRKEFGSSEIFEDDVAVRTVVLSRANASLWYVYLPSLVTYIVGLTFMGNGGLPMIPPTTFLCGDNASSFIFAQNWPGMGVFFHFGLLLVIFANDGIGDSLPSYKPSIFVAILFSGHIAFLLAIQLLMGVHLREDSLEIDDWIRISLMVPWMVASLHLCISLQRLRKHRVLPG